jgi:serine/threonine protein kinase
MFASCLQTMPYMPPELLAHSQLTPQADVYSFGMVMWEVYTAQVTGLVGAKSAFPCLPDLHFVDHMASLIRALMLPASGNVIL